jgi:hypothetical protein
MCVSGYMDCHIKEATEMKLNMNNFNRDGVFIVSHA